MCGKDKLNTVLSELSENSKKIFGDKLKKVILFGSYARGDYDDESDIDVMLMVDMPREELAAYRDKCNSSALPCTGGAPKAREASAAHPAPFRRLDFREYLALRPCLADEFLYENSGFHTKIHQQGTAELLR